MRTIVLLIALLGYFASQTHAEVIGKRPSLDDFLAKSDVWSPELSPSGRYVSFLRYLSDEDKTHVLAVVDLDDPNKPPEHIGFDTFLVNWVEWATDDRILVSLTGLKDLRRNKVVSFYDDFSSRDALMPFSRIVAIDRDGGNAVTMFSDSQRLSRNIWLSAITDFLPDDPDHIMMPAYLGGDLDLFRLNINDGSHERVAIGTQNTYAWFVDRNGEPAFRYNSNARGSVITVFAREDRENGKIRWKKIKTLRLNRDNETREAATEFEPLSAGPTETSFYVAARPEGADTTGIYLYDFEQDVFLETIVSRPDIDVKDALFDRRTGNFLGTVYWDDRLVIDLASDEIQAHIDGLSTYFGDQANVIPVASSRNGQRWLLRVRGPMEVGSYHVYDLEQANTREILGQVFELIGKQLAPTQIIEYQARDGLALKGYLTRPYDLSEGERPPLIVLPHGGPEARDYVTYDRLVQYLASLGYQIFQPNFRGSGGFGQTFADMGDREYGKAMQTDVEDGFHHLVEAGFADADQACILGYSYGGYVAMAAATLTPNLYECVIAGAGLSDLIKMLYWERKEEGRSSEAYKYWVKKMGHPKNDKAALQAVSPALLADKVTAPLLLIHGEEDNIVPIKQSEYMYKAMQRAGKPVEFLRLEEAKHSYRTDEERRLEYETITAFLAEHLPVKALNSDATTAEIEVIEQLE